MSEIQGVARFKFHEGRVEEFKRLSAQVMDIARVSSELLGEPSAELAALLAGSGARLL